MSEWEKVPSEGDWEPVPTKKATPPKKKRTIGRGNPADIRRRNLLKRAKNDKYLKKVVRERGMPALDRAAEAQDMGGLKKSMILLGREGDKMMAGAGDVVDFLVAMTDRKQNTNLPDWMGISAEDKRAAENLPPDLGDQAYNFLTGGGEEGAMKRTNERRSIQSENDRVMKEMLENQGMAGISTMLPYMVTGLGAPKAGKAVASALSVADKAVKAGAKTSTSKAGKALHKMQESAWPPVRYVGDEIGGKVDAFGGYLAKRAANKPYSQPDPFREGFLPTALGGGGIGALEGGLHYDMNPVEGAISGTAGGASGKFLEPILSKAPNYNLPDRQALIDWAELNGMKFPPGFKQGSNKKQKFEHGLRESKDFSDSMAMYDRSNQLAMNDMAYQSMGMPHVPKEESVKTALQKHKASLKSEFNDIENRTIGRFEDKQIDMLQQGYDDLLEIGSQSTMEAAKVVEPWLKKFRDSQSSVRGPDGRFRQKTFDGSKYKDMRSALKMEADNALTATGQQTSASKALKVLLKNLDKAMENGIRETGKDATVAQWKDLNERYAMTKLMLEKGMDTEGMVDATKLGQHFRSTDMERMILEEGGDRITNLHRMVKLNDALRHQAGSGLSGTGMESIGSTVAGGGDSKRSVAGKLLDLPGAGHLPFLPSAYLGMYRSGFPGSTGLAGMSQAGTPNASVWNPGTFTRPAAMSSQIHPEIIRQAKRGGKKGAEYGAKGIDYISDKLMTLESILGLDEED